MNAIFYRTAKGATPADCKTAEWYGKLREGQMFEAKVRVKDRSLSQNAISHIWYGDVARVEKQYPEGKVKCLCKLHIGVPILRAEDEEFNRACELCIDHLAYEEKIEAMEILPVTSRMNRDQMSRYLEAMQQNYEGRVLLIFPGDGPRR